MDPADQFSASLGLVDRIVAAIARRQRLSAHEAEELLADVRLRLLEHDYAVLRKFEGRSSLATYLAVVIERLWLDRRVAAWGKWRPSAEAKRLGPVAVLLDRLMHRDGLTASQAVEAARTNHGVESDEQALFAMASRLPRRATRRTVPAHALDDTPADGDDGEAALLRTESGEAARRARRCLKGVLETLPVQDRLVLRMRFEDGRPVSVIARTLGLEQKLLYRRLESLLRDLRTRLEFEGVRHQDLAWWFDDPGAGAAADAGLSENRRGRPSL